MHMSDVNEDLSQFSSKYAFRVVRPVDLACFSAFNWYVLQFDTKGIMLRC
jgi:hypothetical protein